MTRLFPIRIFAGALRLCVGVCFAAGMVPGCAPLGVGYPMRVGELAADSYDPLVIDDVSFGFSGSAGVQLGNVGDGVLVVSLVLRDDAERLGFSVTPSAVVLDADEVQYVAVQYVAATFESQAAVLDITHDGLGGALEYAISASTDDDADGDGYVHEENGGDDCNDRNPFVHPGALEVWYDGIAQDCDAWSDYDADFDGYDRLIYGGSDCDDTDPEIYPGAFDPEGDGVDQDCDGEE